MFNHKLFKKYSFNLGSLLCLIGAVYVMSYFLLYDDQLPISISAMLSSFSHIITPHWHVLAVGLLPVYVALMIFGTAVLGACLGSVLHRWVVRFFNK